LARLCKRKHWTYLEILIFKPKDFVWRDFKQAANLYFGSFCNAKCSVVILIPGLKKQSIA